MIRHIWFDLSGTLYREGPAWVEAHYEYLYGVMEKVTGETDRRKTIARFRELKQQHSSNSGVFMALGKPADYWQKQFEKLSFKDLLQPDPEIIDTLGKLKDLAPLSIFTNVHVPTLLDMLGTLKIPAGYFTHFLSTAELGKPKPDPAGFKRMVELSGVPAGENLYVGDIVPKDILPAKQLGMQTCLMWGESPEATYSVRDYPELLTIVRASLS